MKVRGAKGARLIEVAHAFTDGEWKLIRVVADGLEWSYGWSELAAQRLRFIMDSCYATAMQASEFVDATLGDIQRDDRGEDWLTVVGKGAKAGTVTLPPLAMEALDRYLSLDLPFASRIPRTSKTVWSVECVSASSSTVSRSIQHEVCVRPQSARKACVNRPGF